jgi:N-acetylmuramoyl-L-alanine amidase
VCSVVYQSNRDNNGNPVRNQCQFSWYCDGKTDTPRNAFWYWAAEEIAVDILTGLETNITNGSTHYHATYVDPYWASTKTYQTQIGSHIFYSWD